MARQCRRSLLPRERSPPIVAPGLPAATAPRRRVTSVRQRVLAQCDSVNASQVGTVGKRPSLDPERCVEELVAAGLEPLEPYPGNTLAPWRCRCLLCNASVITRHNTARKKRWPGCRACAQKATRQVAHPPDLQEALSACGVTPAEPYPGSVTALWRLQCNGCGASVQSTLRLLRSGGLKCEPCAYARRKAGGKRFTEDQARNLMLKAGFVPREPYPGARMPWRSTCSSCGRDVSPRLDSVANSGTGCMYCTGRVVHEDDAFAVAKMASLTPLEPFPGAQVPWACRCQTCGATVRPKYSNLRSGQGGCRSCGAMEGARKRVMDESRAVEVVRAAGHDPLESYPGAAKPWLLSCSACGHVARYLYLNIARRGSQCSGCSTSGFDSSAPAVVYLLRHEGMGALKIGVAGMTTSRIEIHGRHGWAEVARREVGSGTEALLMEGDVLLSWRAIGGVPHLRPEDLPQGGWTETAPDGPLHELAAKAIVLSTE